MSSTTPILIYAELLAIIGQVSVACVLPCPSSPGNTKAAVSPDGLTLTLYHRGVEQSISLPGQVAAPPTLPIPKDGPKILSWRLPLMAKPDVRAVASPEAIVPWSAGDLRPGSAVTCRACNASIVPTGSLKVWKDLPSENWAEMMEFWHCHKPHDHNHGHSAHLESRGYGASSRISAQPGVGLVDLTSILISTSDMSTHSIEPRKQAASQERNDAEHETTKESGPIHCSKCETQLGMANEETASASLFKWQISIDQVHQGALGEPSLVHCVSSMLLATANRSGCSKSILLPIKTRHPPGHEGTVGEQSKRPEPLLNIWLFNANITFSSTVQPKSPLKAIKVLYRLVSREEADKMLDSMTSDVQDISLPRRAIEEVVKLLDDSNLFVPPGDRSFRGWTVGLLEKWDSE
ncbi:ubiquitin-conjugating enzyme E2-binding protein [Xylariomycetidae sp. FL0641]|nr:ubiquitin-conjugating enzyme E2-binding protein [Xylariomycetidae sp. FL0641]